MKNMILFAFLLLVSGSHVCFGQGSGLSTKPWNYENGIKELAKFNYRMAETHFNSCIKQDPTALAECLEGRSEAYMGLKDLDKALADVNEAIKLKPSFTGHLLRSAIYCKQGKADQSKADLAAADKLIGKTDDSCGIVRFVAVSVDLDINQLRDALYEARKLAGVAYKDTNSQTVAASFRSAIASYSEIIKKYPTAPTLFSERANLYKELSPKLKMNEVMRTRDMAIDDYSRAIALRSNGVLSFNRVDGDDHIGRAQLTLNALTSTSNLNTALAALLGGDEKKNAVTDAKGRSRSELIAQIIADTTVFIGIDRYSSAAGQAFFIRGKAHLLNEDKANAAKDLQAAIKLIPDYQAAKIELSRLGASTQTASSQPATPPPVNQPNSAATTNSELSAQRHFRQANQYFLEGKVDEAMNSLNAGLAVSPSDVKLLTGRGQLYRVKRQHDLALKDFDKLILLYPNSANAYYERAMTYAEMNLEDKFIVDLGKAVGLDPKHAAALGSRSQYFFTKGQFRLALIDINDVIKLEPNRVAGYYLRGQIYQALNELADAIVDYNKAVTLAPNETEPITRRGTCYNALNKFDDAVRDFTKALELAPENTIALFHRAFAQARLGKTELAITDLRKILSINPNVQEAKDALKQLGAQP